MMQTMFFQRCKMWVEECWFWKHRKLLALIGFSFLLANCATSRSDPETSPTSGIVPVPLYNPVITTQPGGYGNPPGYSAPESDSPKASKKKKKKSSAKKTKKKKKVATKGKRKAGKVAKRKSTAKRKTLPKRRATSRRSGGTSTISQQGRQIAEDSTSLDNLKVAGQYALGDTLSLTVSPLSKGEVSVVINGSRPGGQPCNFSGKGTLRNGATTMSDNGNNTLDFTFSDKSVIVQGGTLGESCGGEYSQK